MYLSNKWSFLSVGLCLMLGIVLLNHITAHATATLSMSLQSEITTMSAAGDIGEMSIVLANPDTLEVQAATLQLSFDPAVVEVASVTQGSDCFDFVPRNNFNNGVGTIAYDAVQLGQGCMRDATVATVAFQCLTNSGMSPIQFTVSELIASGSNQLLDHQTYNGIVQCGGFLWGSESFRGETTHGAYDKDGVAPLAAGNIVQLMSVGPNGVIDKPNCSDPTNSTDDVVLETKTIGNNARGYVPLSLFMPDAGDINTQVYIRAWSASDLVYAAHYGDSPTVTLGLGDVFNTLQWFATQSCSASSVQLSHLESTINEIKRPLLIILFSLAGIFFFTALSLSYTKK